MEAVCCIQQTLFLISLILRIGVAEKGFITAQLSVHTSAGHSSMPPRESSIGIMSNAVAK